MSNTLNCNDDTHKYCDEGGGSGASSKEMSTSCEQNKNVGSSSNSTSSTDIDLAVDGIDKMSISNTSIRLSTCACCGKEGSDNDMNTCNKCDLVKYCNAACKKKHRSKHKKKCDRRVAELHDEALFKQPPQDEDCPICFLRMPSLWTGRKYQECCGKEICSGCIHAPVYDNQGNKVAGEKCPFCRIPAFTSDEEMIERNDKRIETKDAIAIYGLGCCYDEGLHGLPQNYTKALELWHHAGELGHSGAYFNIGCAYQNGIGVQKDVEKARHYWELAAMGGHVGSRFNLGINERNKGNFDKAIKHFMISVCFGCSNSLEATQALFKDGRATKDDYTKALRLYQAYLDEVKSDQRDKAAAFDNDKYYD